MGYVPQKLQIDAKLPLTVRDLLALAIQRRPIFLGLTRRTQQTLHAILDSVQAPHALLDRPVEKISGGELQRVLLGLAIQPCPELLLLDEPAAGMNPDETEQLMHLIAGIRERFKLTVLVIEHHMDLVMRLCESIVVLNFGQKLAEGTADEIRGDPRVVEAYLGSGGN